MTDAQLTVIGAVISAIEDPHFQVAEAQRKAILRCLGEVYLREESLTMDEADGLLEGIEDSGLATLPNPLAAALRMVDARKSEEVL